MLNGKQKPQSLDAYRKGLTTKYEPKVAANPGGSEEITVVDSHGLLDGPRQAEAVTQILKYIRNGKTVKVFTFKLSDAKTACEWVHDRKKLGVAVQMRLSLR